MCIKFSAKIQKGEIASEKVNWVEHIYPNSYIKKNISIILYKIEKLQFTCIVFS